MEKVDQRLDARGEQGVDEALVEVEATAIDGAGPRGQDARPADAEAVCARPRSAISRRLPGSGGSGRRRRRPCCRRRSAPGWRAKVSQIDGPRPSSAAAPSIWYAEAAKPQVKSPGRAGRAGPGRCRTRAMYSPADRTRNISGSLHPIVASGVGLRSDPPTARPAGERVGWQATGRGSSLRLSTKGRSVSCPRLRAAPPSPPRAPSPVPRPAQGPQAARAPRPRRQARCAKRRARSPRIGRSRAPHSVTTGGSVASSTRSTRARSRTRNDDGVGDLPGLIDKLDYLNDGTERSLGVDAIWLSPIHPSPGFDVGYDVADYDAIDPLFGTLDDFDRLVAEAHRRGIRIMLDLVMNHTSSAHRWFEESRRDPAGPYGDWYLWRDGVTRPLRARPASRTTGRRSSAVRRGPGTRSAASSTCTRSCPSSPT